MKKYLITDPKYYTTTPKPFGEALNRSLIKYTPDFVCFRDKTDGDKKELLKAFVSTIKDKELKAFVNGSLELALEYGLDGVHLQSSQQALIQKAKAKRLLVIVSCHSAKEAIDAFEKGADFVTLSPVYETPHKGVPLGIEAFSDILAAVDKTRVFALGGIDDEYKVAQLEKLGVFGFASIRYFVR
jgi:thiamine-phosphate pyrophosphorylase